MLAGFPHTTVKASEGRFNVEYEGKAITVFTARSAERDLAQLKSLIQSAVPGGVPVIVAPYRSEFAELFTQGARFVFITPASFAADLPEDDRLIADDAALEYFVNSVGQDDKFEIHVVPQWQGLTEAMRQAAQQLFERAAVRGYALYAILAGCGNTDFRLNAVRLPTDIARLKELCPDLLVMAGPSLDAALHEIARAKLIWCADTALPALAARGIFPRWYFRWMPASPQANTSAVLPHKSDKKISYWFQIFWAMPPFSACPSQKSLRTRVHIRCAAVLQRHRIRTHTRGKSARRRGLSHAQYLCTALRRRRGKGYRP